MLKEFSDDAIAVVLYALQAYEDFVDGDRTDRFVESYYKLLEEFQKEYRNRNLEWKVFYKHEP